MAQNLLEANVPDLMITQACHVLNKESRLNIGSMFNRIRNRHFQSLRVATAVAGNGNKAVKISSA
jgi:hypothetical protein